MIPVTDEAAEELQEVIDANATEPGLGVKLVLDAKGGIRLTIAPATEGDEVMRRGEEPLLILDPRVAGKVAGLVLDVTIEEEAGVPRKHFLLRPAESQS